MKFKWWTSSPWSS